MAHDCPVFAVMWGSWESFLEQRAFAHPRLHKEQKFFRFLVLDMCSAESTNDMAMMASIDYVRDDQKVRSVSRFSTCLHSCCLMLMRRPSHASGSCAVWLWYLLKILCLLGLCERARLDGLL